MKEKRRFQYQKGIVVILISEASLTTVLSDSILSSNITKTRSYGARVRYIRASSLGVFLAMCLIFGNSITCYFDLADVATNHLDLEGPLQ